MWKGRSRTLSRHGTQRQPSCSGSWKKLKHYQSPYSPFRQKRGPTAVPDAELLMLEFGEEACIEASETEGRALRRGPMPTRPQCSASSLISEAGSGKTRASEGRSQAEQRSFLRVEIDDTKREGVPQEASC